MTKTEMTAVLRATRCMGGTVLVQMAVDLAEGDSKELAAELAAQFPKSAGVKTSTLTYARDGSYANGSVTVPTLRWQAHFESNGVTGSKNETGLRRYRSLRKHLDRLGYQVTWHAKTASEMQSEAELEQYLATQQA